MTPEQIVTLAERYAAHRNLKLSSVGVYCANDGGFILRLKEGGDSGSRILLRTAQWFSDHWACDLEWPEGINRPEPTEKQARAS